MNKKVNPENSHHINEVNQEFARTMNKIIFDKHLKESGNDLISTNLTLPPASPPQPVPDYAMITIP